MLAINVVGASEKQISAFQDSENLCAFYIIIVEQTPAQGILNRTLWNCCFNNNPSVVFSSERVEASQKTPQGRNRHKFLRRRLPQDLAPVKSVAGASCYINASVNTTKLNRARDVKCFFLLPCWMGMPFAWNTRYSKHAAVAEVCKGLWSVLLEWHHLACNNVVEWLRLGAAGSMLFWIARITNSFTLSVYVCGQYRAHVWSLIGDLMWMINHIKVEPEFGTSITLCQAKQEYEIRTCLSYINLR